MTECRCAIIADDLTGACDSVAQFRMRGARSAVILDGARHWDGEYAAIAVSTDTRCGAEREIALCIREAAGTLAKFRPQVLFKKIDSLLRGNPGAEIAAAMEAFRCEAAIITPAFPALGRMVREGCLCVDCIAGWEPIAVAGQLRLQGLAGCDHIIAAHEITQAVERGCRYVSVEAACDEDLEAAVAEGLRSERRILWAGSAGLAAALAKALYPERIGEARYEELDLPVLFCIGSNHAVTARQIARLFEEKIAGEFQADRIVDNLRQGQHTILHIPPSTSACLLQNLFEEMRQTQAAVFVSGGDTASLICQAAGAGMIEIEGEIAIGLPRGRARGGMLDGRMIATKSGAFGEPDALLRVADFFKCRNR